MNHIILITIIYILGIVAFSFDVAVPLLTAVILFTIFAGFKKILPLGLCFLMYLMFFFGWFNTSLHFKDGDMLGRVQNAKDVIVQGRIISVPQKSLNQTRLRFYADIEAVNHIDGADSKTIVDINNLDSKFKDVKIGDVVSLEGNIKKPYSATNPSQFDYAKYLKNKDVFSTFYVKDDNYKILHSPKFCFQCGFINNWWAILRSLDVVRENIIKKHSKYVPSPKLEVLGGIVFGDEAVNPPDDVKQIFINSGLLHLLAASGLNVGIIFFMWFWLATRMGLGFRTTIISSVFFILLYTFMTGFPPSILRASVMLLFVLIGKIIHRETDNLALIFFVGFIMLICNPKMLMNVGFELSFLVTIGLIICVPIIIDLFKAQELGFKNKYQKAHPLLKKILYFISPAYLVGIIAVPLVAQLFVMPLQIYYFNTFTPYSILANIIVVPFVAVISFFGFLSSILSLVPFISDFILKISDFIILPFTSGLLNVSNYFANLPGSIISLSSLNWVQIIIYYSFILVFFKNLKDRFNNKKETIIFVVIAIVFVSTFVRIPDKNFEIMAFDVGNADSFLIKTPENKYMLIDTGKLPYRGSSSAKTIINEYFKDKNIKELEFLILTHFDDDHSGGTLDVLKNTSVKNIIIAGKNCDTQNSCNILRYLKDNNLRYEIAENDKVIYEKENLKIKTYRANFEEEEKFENENSIITLVDFNGKKALFMGDGGVLAYNRLKKYLPENIDILKVGHHGARNVLNEEMLKHLNPGFALISVGINNYGHPDKSNSALLDKTSIKSLLTRDYGCLKFMFGKNIEPYFYHNEHFEPVLKNKNTSFEYAGANEAFFKDYDQKTKSAP